ncbi:MAG: cytochrome c maturation protein CcmE [candidate division Zixibacteria bacterium]|nr:cytochrome c maturation protein CcmE [candidate division Zixibacteria bacterium]MDH3936917.1 cytochrome c maturation protein CcmE [candidate division Zixibacteria bacterium]MDH4033358.1 cytochrome c maturation protein CcmE [candidate division Zixibacteria bacterium]
MNAKYIIGGIIIVLFVVWGGYSFMQTTIQYVSIDEARTAERTVQVMGKIDFDVVNFNAEQQRLEFAIYDAEATNEATAKRMPVVYHGVVPGNFEQATSVVLKGKSSDGVFEAEQMLVKCPSKYQGEGTDGYQDIEKHQDGNAATGA